MKKMQLNALSMGGALSREQMKKIAGGGYYPCVNQCNTDNDCPPLNGSGSPGWCEKTLLGECHNRDGSLQGSVGTCIYQSGLPG